MLFKKIIMLEQLFKLIENESQQEIINNPAIPNEQNNHAVGLAADSIFNGLQGKLANGGLKDVLGMFAGNQSTGTDNELVNGISGNFISNLMNKFGIDNEKASAIAKSVIPSVLGKLVNKTNDPNDSSFNINGVIGSLMGGDSSQGSPVQIDGITGQQGGGIDFGSIVKNLSKGGLDSNHDGSIGLDDLSGIIGKVTGGKQGANGESGGVMDLLKGFMK